MSSLWEPLPTTQVSYYCYPHSDSIYSLINLIVRDPVKYPDNMSADFKSFLQGLLNKTPSERLSWPELLHHPFIKETEQEKRERKMNSEDYHRWAARAHPNAQEEANKEIIDLSGAESGGETQLTKGIPAAVLQPFSFPKVTKSLL